MPPERLLGHVVDRLEKLVGVMINLVQRMDDVFEAMTERRRSLFWLLGGGRHKIDHRVSEGACVLGQLFRNDRDVRSDVGGFRG